MPSRAPDARAAEPGSFSLRPSARLYARLYRDPSTLLGGYSHDHVVQGTVDRSSIVFEPEAPQRCRAQLRIPVASLQVDEPTLRQRLGIAGTLDDADRKSVREHMLADDQLDGRRFPSIEIVVQSCVEGATQGQYLADVAVTIHGKTQQRARAVTIRLADGRLSSRGVLRFTHADFGMKPYSAFLGGVRNLEAIDLLWTLEAEPVR